MTDSGSQNPKDIYQMLCVHCHTCLAFIIYVNTLAKVSFVYVQFELSFVKRLIS